MTERPWAALRRHPLAADALLAAALVVLELPVPGSSGVGHGLVGMRERVGLYGGVLRAGARAGGGFRVYATIPVEQPGGCRRDGRDRRAQ